MINPAYQTPKNALVLLVLAMVLFLLLVLVPLVSYWAELHEEKLALSFRLEREQALLQRKEAISQTLSQLSLQAAGQNYFCQSSTESLAAADLQNLIKNLTLQVGGQISSTQVLPSKVDNQFIQIPVKVQLTASNEVFKNLLARLETNAPLLLMDELDVLPVRAVRTSIFQQTDSDGVLNIGMEISCLMRVIEP